MALMIPGALAGQLSGKEGSVVFSRNRYGAHTRMRVMPVRATSVAALNHKALFGEVSRRWSTLTTADQEAWKAWAQTNPITNRVGVRQTLDGHAAFVRCNTVLLAAGVSPLSAPGIAMAPAPFTPGAITAEDTPTLLSIVLSTSPLPDNYGVIVNGCVTNNSSINYVDKLMKRLAYVPSGQTTPLLLTTAIQATFGDLTTGQTITLDFLAVGENTGLVANRTRAIATVAHHHST